LNELFAGYPTGARFPLAFKSKKIDLGNQSLCFAAAIYHRPRMNLRESAQNCVDLARGWFRFIDVARP
jgi:hypothetical protein